MAEPAPRPAADEVRIVIACGMPALGAGLRQWLERPDRGWRVVGTVSSAGPAAAAAALHRAHVVVASDDVDAAAVAAELGRHDVPAHLLAVVHGDDVAREALLARAGASGVIGSVADRRGLSRAVSDLCAGRCVLGVEALRLAASTTRPASLTTRQREVLALLAQGLTTREIAARLVVTPSTVKTHIGRLGEKLGIQGRFALAVAAGASAQPVATHSGSERRPADDGRFVPRPLGVPTMRN